jgi:hypothetical protein
MIVSGTYLTGVCCTRGHELIVSQVDLVLPSLSFSHSVRKYFAESPRFTRPLRS